MARIVLPIAIVGLLLLLYALWRGAYPDLFEGAGPPPAETATEPAAEPPVVTGAPKTSVRGSEAVPDRRPVAPQLDVVRIDEDGDTVIAGEAQPGASVTITTQDRTLAVVKADDHGKWVALPEEPLPVGDHAVMIEATGNDGKTEVGDKTIIVSVPEGNTGEKPLVVAVPTKDFGASEVLQRPVPSLSRPEKPMVAAEAPANGKATEETQPTDPAAPTPAGRQEGVSVDSVDYDDQGNLTLAGKAAPGSVVGSKIASRDSGSESLGEARTDEKGGWRLRVERPVAPGRYDLTVEERSPEGAPRSRIRLPFERADPITDFPAGEVVVVQPGNSLWRIAHKIYGHGVRYTVIYAANRAQIGNPDLIFPGQIFSVPQENRPDRVPG